MKLTHGEEGRWRGGGPAEEGSICKDLKGDTAEPQQAGKESAQGPRKRQEQARRAKGGTDDQSPQGRPRSLNSASKAEGRQNAARLDY